MPGFNRDYHFIMKELGKKLERQFNCFGGNTEKYIILSVPIEKQVTRTDEYGEQIWKTISYRLQFTLGARFMASSLSNVFDNLAEWINKIKCTNCNICCFKYTNAKDDFVKHKCLHINKDYQKQFEENLKKRFANTYKFANQNIVSFVAARCLSI